MTYQYQCPNCGGSFQQTTPHVNFPCLYCQHPLNLTNPFPERLQNSLKIIAQYLHNDIYTPANLRFENFTRTNDGIEYSFTTDDLDFIITITMQLGDK